MLVVLLYFLYASNNTFHLQCGMVTLTLFDFVAITGLRQTGEDFEPNYIDEDTIKFGEGVSDEERIYFLVLWLSKCVFCSRSLQVAKKFLAMANQLHVGQKIGLSQMIIASLYESLDESVDFLKAYKVGTNILFVSPLCLFQLWLNAIFKALMP